MSRKLKFEEKTEESKKKAKIFWNYHKYCIELNLKSKIFRVTITKKSWRTTDAAIHIPFTEKLFWKDLQKLSG